MIFDTLNTKKLERGHKFFEIEKHEKLNFQSHWKSVPSGRKSVPYEELWTGVFERVYPEILLKKKKKKFFQK